MYAEIFYGSYMKVDGDSELVEEYEEQIPGIRSIKSPSGEWFLYMGHVATSIVEGDNTFDEMSLLRMIDPKQMRLTDDLVKEVRGKLEKIPEDLRNKFNAPRFYVLWGAS